MLVPIMLAQTILGQINIAHAARDSQQDFIVSGIVIDSRSGNLIERFTQYLSTQSAYPLQIVYVKKYSVLSHALRENPKAIGWTSSALYVQDNKSNGQQLVAAPLFNNKPNQHSLILTRRDRSEKTLADFKNGVLAYSDPASTTAFLSPKYALFKQGIDINKQFRLLLTTGSHENSINALINNLADVAAIDERAWQRYLTTHPKASNVVYEIERMGPLPLNPIVAGNKVSADTIHQLSLTLLNMKNDAAGKKLLSELQLDDFIEDSFDKKNANFYQPVKNMLKQVTIEPDR